MIKRIKLGGVKQRVIALIIGIAVFVYSVYHVVSLFGEDMTTVATGVSTETQVVDAKGYVFRNERVLYSENTGVADYLKPDGAKVSLGEPLAKVGQSGDKTQKSMLKFYDSKIAILEQSVNSGDELADLPDISADISDSYYSLAQMLATGNTAELGATSEKLLLSMNRYDLLTNKDTTVADTLSAMSAARDNILKSGGSQVTEVSEDSGYFYSYTDGYESYFTLSAADSITPDSFEELTRYTKPDTRAQSSAYGKLSESSEWRFVIRMTGATSGYFKKDGTYKLQFHENGNSIIPMRLTASIADSRNSGRILVFSADRLPEGFVFDRCQSVSIQMTSVSGIYVPRTAIHHEKEGLCVYVLKGSVVKMRRIEIVHEGTDYVLCATEPEGKGSIEYLGTNELLIVGGSNLFDGRILD